MKQQTDDEPKHLATITANLNLARAHLARVREDLAALELQGMYDAVPTESWQDRGGDGRYLYLYFHEGAHGYTGPGGRRKLYVGCDPARIAEARRMAANRRRYEDLFRLARQLEAWIVQRRGELAALARATAHWPQEATR